MSERYCYWSVVDGDYAFLMAALVRSARRVGVLQDFHVWCDRPVPGAIGRQIQGRDAWYLFKLHYLKKAVKKLNYDYFVWLDADNYFVRNPGNILRVLHGSPVHASLESDACLPQNTREDWWGCSLRNYATLMRFKGVRSNAIFNLNGGFWIVHHDVIDTFCRLALDFWAFSRKAGYEFADEPCLAYAVHMLCGDPYRHTLRRNSDVWASDWTGVFRDRLPAGRAWEFTDYFTGETFPVNPAIVHAMRSKEAMLAEGRVTAQRVG